MLVHYNICIVMAMLSPVLGSFSKFHDNAVEHGCFLIARISLNIIEYHQISTVQVFDSR